MTVSFVCVGLYQKNVSEAFFRQIGRIYPDATVYMITRPADFTDFKNFKNLVLIDENTVIPQMDFAVFKDMCLNIPNTYNNGIGLWQQFLKIYSCMVDSIPEKYVIIDMDFIILKKFPFFDGDIHLFNHSVFERYFHTLWDFNMYIPYVEHIINAPCIHTDMVSEYMPFTKKLVQQMIAHVETTHKENFVQCCMAYDVLNSDFAMSEYAMYASYIHTYHHKLFGECEIKFKRTGNDFYLHYTDDGVLKIFDKIWGLDAVCFENWFWKPCVPSLHIAVAKLRKITGYYGRLPLTLPYVEHATDMATPAYWNKLRLRCKVFNIFDWVYWQHWFAKKKRLYIILALLCIWILWGVL